ncbi:MULTISPECIES: hypothetical protein [Sorangium]|uniref:hypothetical protein n=1 Tax=Sorangium TaxID=39643 RepID=UPI00101A094A|nr:MULTISPECIES: hypothetical protein [Sorangium]
MLVQLQEIEHFPPPFTIFSVHNFVARLGGAVVRASFAHRSRMVRFSFARSQRRAAPSPDSGAGFLMVTAASLSA